MTLTIRPVTLADETHLANFWEERTLVEVDDLLDRALTMRERQRGEGLIAEWQGVVCGFGMITLWLAVAEISDLAVLPPYQNRGIGTQIIFALTNYAISRRFKIIEIGVLASNVRALTLYQRLGFVEHRVLYHQTPDGNDQVLYLQKLLT
jgi:ribosomal protein S18 acetylase RimI-like enzyme